MKKKNKLPNFSSYPLFYQKVWSVVSKIPKGEVRTYKWVAQQVGSPNAVRAVGQALKNNPFAPIIPCHRVIKSDGTLGGYRLGIKKKIALLSSEGIKIEVSKNGKKLKIKS